MWNASIKALPRFNRGCSSTLPKPSIAGLAVETDWRVSGTAVQCSCPFVRTCKASPTARPLESTSGAPVVSVAPVLDSYCRCTPVDRGKVSAGGRFAKRWSCAFVADQQGAGVPVASWPAAMASTGHASGALGPTAFGGWCWIRSMGRNMAGFSSHRRSATLVESSSGDRLHGGGPLRSLGRLFDVMERWQSPVDRARLEIV